MQQCEIEERQGVHGCQATKPHLDSSIHSHHPAFESVRSDHFVLNRSNKIHVPWTDLNLLDLVLVSLAHGIGQGAATDGGAAFGGKGGLTFGLVDIRVVHQAVIAFDVSAQIAVNDLGRGKKASVI